MSSGGARLQGRAPASQPLDFLILTVSAAPGYSEHQTGLSLDIAPVGNASCSTITCIASTPQGMWLKRNSWRFGFILRYESGYGSVTGYSSEPWHVRFVGTRLATGYHHGGWHTLEQFLDEPAAPTY